MAKAKKETAFCLYCERPECNCINPCVTKELLIKRLEAELQRQRTRYRFPTVWDREAAKVEGLKIKARLENVDKPRAN